MAARKTTTWAICWPGRGREGYRRYVRRLAAALGRQNEAPHAAMGGFSLAPVSLAVLGVGVGVVVVGVTLVDVVDVTGLVPVVLVGVALMHVVSVAFGVVLVSITLVGVVDVAGLVTVVFVGIALVDVVLLHSLLLLVVFVSLKSDQKPTWCVYCNETVT